MIESEVIIKKSSWRGYFTLKNVNIVIKYFTISDFLITCGYGLIAPIFAVFILENITKSTVAIIGISQGIYLLSSSLGQIPFASLMDKIKGEKDDFTFLIVGSIIISIIPLFYLLINSAWQLYLIQLIYGLATAMSLPGWLAIFTRHIDHEHEALEWGVYRTFTDLGGGVAALAGGFFAYLFGFQYLIIIVSATSFIGALFLLGAKKSILGYKKNTPNSAPTNLK